MFSGEKINITEKRAVLHVPAAPREHDHRDGENVVPQVHAVLDKMGTFKPHRSGHGKVIPKEHSEHRQHRIAARTRSGHAYKLSDTNASGL